MSPLAQGQRPPRIEARVRVMPADVVGDIATAQQRGDGWTLTVRLADGEILMGVAASDCRYMNADGSLGEPVWTPPGEAADGDGLLALLSAVQLGRAIHAGRDPKWPVALQLRTLAAATVAQGHLLRGLLDGDAHATALAREIVGQVKP